MSKSFTPSPSISLPQTPSTSTSATVSQSATISPTATSTETNSTSLSQSATITLPPTLTPSISATNTNTITTSPTATSTETNSTTLSQSATISPPPTPTSSMTHTETFTNTLPPTPTLSAIASQSETNTNTLPPTPSVSLTQQTLSAPLTLSQPLTPSASLPITSSESLSASQTGSRSETFSASASAEVYCAGRNEVQCRAVSNQCNVSTEGSCFARNCSYFTDQGAALCIVMGCAWKKYHKICEKPLECIDIKDATTCQLNMNCRYNAETGVCKRDWIQCDVMESQSDCTNNGCAWNTAAAPKCFKPIVSPELCPLLKNSPTCISQKCLWLDSVGSCEPWDATCDTILPHPTSCELLPSCFYSAERQKCIIMNVSAFDDLTYLLIVSVSSPSIAFPNTPFTVQAVGSQMGEGNPAMPVPFGSASCPSAVDIENHTLASMPSTYDLQLRKGYYETMSAPSVGRYAFCFRANSSVVLGPLGDINISLVPPTITGCGVNPASPFLGEVFEATFVHDTSDAPADPLSKMAMYPTDNSTSSAFVCPPYNASMYVPITRIAEGTNAIAHYSTNERGTYGMCLVNRVLQPVACPSKILINKLAPWEDLEAVRKITADYPKVLDQGIIEFNQQRCKSMGRRNNTAGIAVHPNSMELSFGDGVNAYAGQEQCVFVVKPTQFPGVEVANSGEVLVLDMLYVSLTPGDELRVFVPEAAVGVESTRCSSFGSSTLCRSAYCQWDAASENCDARSSASDGNCPTTISGYALARVVDYDTFNAAGKGGIPTSKDGAIVVVCAPNVGGSAIGVSFKYHTQATLCPNDCTDAFGTVRGSCEKNVVNLWACKCQPGFVGEDCSRSAICRGTGASADVIEGSANIEKLDFKGDACGLLIRVDPAKAALAASTLGASNVDDPTKYNMARYGVGLSFRNFSTPTTTNGTLSLSAQVTVRAGSHNGKIIARVFADDKTLAGAELKRFIIETATSVYVEFSGLEGTSVLMQYTAVSLVCPGKGGATGIPEKKSELCHGKGTCDRIDYEAPETLPAHLYECACESPFASTVEGQTCDTCGFGFMADTFPACKPAIYCGKKCSGNGACVPSKGCLCNSGFYGLDCQLADDKERMTSTSDKLANRIPLNAQDCGNVMNSGGFDRTLLACSLPGASRKCAADPRERGRAYKQQKNDKASLSNTVFGSRRRRGFAALQTTNGSSNASSTAALLLNDTGTDEGIALNKFIPEGSFLADYIRQDNISQTAADIHDDCTVSAWVKATAKTHGVLFAKADSVFYGDGRSPVLEAVLADAKKERDTPLGLLKLPNVSFHAHFAIVLDGATKSVVVIGTDHSTKGGAKDDWMYLRRFRLEGPAANLYDDSWRHVTLKFLQLPNRRIEARLHVDGERKHNDPAYLQCLPWLPKQTPLSVHNISEDPKITFNGDGSSAAWGYGFVGSIDELHAYSESLEDRAVAEEGGGDLLQLFDRSNADMIALMVFCLLSIAACSSALRRLRAQLKQQKDEEERQSAKVHPESEAPSNDVEQEEKGQGEEAADKKSDKGSSAIEVADALGQMDIGEISMKEKEGEAEDDGDFVYSLRLRAAALRKELRSESCEDRAQKEAELRTVAQELHMCVARETSVTATHHEDDSKSHSFLSQAAALREELRSESCENRAQKEVELRAVRQELYMCVTRETCVEVEDEKRVLEATELYMGIGDISAPTVRAQQPEQPDNSENVNDNAKDKVDAQDGEDEEEGEKEKQIRKLYDGIDRITKTQKNEHLTVLEDIHELEEIEKETNPEKKKQRRKKVKAGASEGAASGGGASSAGGMSSSISAITSAWQTVGQMGDAMQLPSAWNLSFGFLGYLVNVNFLSFAGTATIFTAFYMFLFVVSAICIVVALISFARSKMQSQKAIMASLKKVLAERLECLEKEEDYEEPKKPMRERVMLVVALALSLLYSPLTHQSLLIVFCHPSINCYFDCYVDGTHKMLVGLSIIALLFITVGVPIFYLVSIRRAVNQYHTYLHTFDRDLQSKYWTLFVTTVKMPFASLFENATHASSYFEPIYLLVRFVLALILVGVPSESTEQIVAIVVVQCLFTIGVAVACPYIQLLTNFIIVMCQAFVVTLLCLRCAQIIWPMSAAVGTLMVVAAVLMIVVSVAAIIKMKLSGKSSGGGEAPSTEDVAP